MKYMNNIFFSYLASTLFLTFYANSQTVTAEISFGELIDKITILTIKSQRITNEEKLHNVRIELASLQETCSDFIGNREDIIHLQTLLQKINEDLWEIEDAIRVKERNKEFDDEFISIARSVYVTNDKRCAIKKQIDAILGSHITEEKSYEKLSCE
jgi:hypothetical protein